MKKYNIVLLGTSEFTITCYKSLKANKQNIAAIISIPSDKLPLNSIDIKKFCEKNRITYFETADINDESSLDFLRKVKPEIIFSTWPFLIKKDVINSASVGIIGTHPTKIPKNRGRHPIHWMIDFGTTSSYLSFFFIDEGVDTGDVLHQEKFSIIPTKPISYTLKEMNSAAERGIKKIFTKIDLNTKKSRAKQKQQGANYLRKRNIHDSIVDLRMRGKDLLNLHNSFAPPYPGITFIWDKYCFKVVKMSFKTSTKKDLESMEHGKVLKILEKTLVAKCRDGLITMQFDQAVPVALMNRKYIMPPTFYLAKYSKLVELINTSGT